MSRFLAESAVEELCLEYFADLMWAVLHGPNIAPGEAQAERRSYRDIMLEGRLRAAIAKLNDGFTQDEVTGVVDALRRVESADLMTENWRIHRLAVHGIPLERRLQRGETRDDMARLLDFDNPEENDFVVVNQLRVEEDRTPRRPDVVAYVNGIPLGIIELKVPGEERATLRGAYDQLRTYCRDIPTLMSCTGVSVISTGTQARMGALGGGFEHYAPWKTIDGQRLAPAGSPELEVLVRGVFEPAIFLDLVRNFVSSPTSDPV